MNVMQEMILSPSLIPFQIIKQYNIENSKGKKTKRSQFALQEYLAYDIEKYRTQLLSLSASDTVKKALIQSQIQKDYVTVDVFFQTLNVVNIDESPMFDVKH